jgi:hypothetical protein
MLSTRLNLYQLPVFKNIMIINDASSVVSEWCHNLEHPLQSSIMFLESSIMLLELSIMLRENI